MNHPEKFGHPDSYSQQPDVRKQKNCIKFNRKQQNLRTDRKRTESNTEATERICFISPQKVSGLSHQLQGTSSIINNNILSAKENFVIPKEQSYILPHESPFNFDHKMNDSILSLMNQLKGDNDQRHQDEVQEYLHEIMNLREEIEALQQENNFLKTKANDIELLQEFLIQRQTYISQVTDRNIYLSEQLHLIQKEKQKLLQELNQLRFDYTNEHQMYQNYIKNLKKQRQNDKEQLDMMLKLNVELNQRLQQKITRKTQKIKRHSTRNTTQTDQINSPIKNAVNNRLKTSIITNQSKNSKNRYQLNDNQQRKIIDGLQTVRSKQTDFSQLNVRSMDQFSILQKLNDQTQPCDCKDQIKKLKQKISYHEIEIDILKRLKINSEKVKTDNEKLKSQNKKLLAKIQSLCNKNSKNERKRSKNNSDSSLQLSLSPKKYQK